MANNSPPDFAGKLDFVLKAITMSKGRLAAEARVDKSIVGRWTRGLVQPTEHNLANVTRVLSKSVPGFNLLAWQLPLPEFTATIARLSGEAGARPSDSSAEFAEYGERVAPSLLAFDPRTFLGNARAVSERAVEEELSSIPGIYVEFRLGLRGTGALLPDLVFLWRQGNRLFFQQSDPLFTYRGEAFVLHHQLFLIGEEGHRADSLNCIMLNGCMGQRAIRMDGILLAVIGDRSRAPVATPVVLQRIADAPAGQGPHEPEVIERIRARARQIFEAGAVRALIDPAVAEIIHPQVGAKGGPGPHELVMGIPPGRSIARSDVDSDAEFVAYVDKVRAALLGEDIHALPFAPLNAAKITRDSF
jgi:hypothetical protein